MLKRIFVIIVTSLLITAPVIMIASNEAEAVSPLVLSNPTPADGSVVTESTGQIKVRFEDDPAVKVQLTDVVLRVDDKIVNHTITYDSTVVYDSCGTPSSVYSYNKGWIVGPVMTSGVHTVSVTITDIVGNTAVLNWQYAMDAFEITTDPKNNDKVATLNPQITVNAANLNSKDTDDINATIKVNGTNRPVTIKRIDKDHWTVTTNVYNLENQAPVNVSGNISNSRGVSKSYSFVFTPSLSPPTLNVAHVKPDTVYTKLTRYNERFVRLVWVDQDGIDPATLVMTVNQQPVEAAVEGDSIIGPELENGTYTISVKIKDKIGNEASKTYNVTFKVPPMLLKPANLYTSLQPLLTFPLDVMGTGLDPAKTVLSVDGKQYPVTISGETITSQMPKMANETDHTVSLVAVDNEGLSSSFSLQFGVNTFGEMPFNNNGCTGCHNSRYYSEQNKWIHTKSPDQEAIALQVGMTDPINCGHCHEIAWQMMTQENYCYYCHDVVDTSDPHKTTANETSPIPPVPALKRPGTDCVNCHTTLSRVPEEWWPGAFTLPVGFNYTYDPAESTEYPYKHLIYSSHQTVYESVYGNCKSCHSSNLTRTHNNKKSKTTGELMDCGTCHLSNDTLVKNAIANNQTQCSACHNTQQGHEELHTGSLDSKCTTCHKTTLTQDHLTRSDSSGNTYTCSTCHNSTDKKVVRTIAEGSLNCAGCHLSGHNLQLSDEVPSDIPLYEGLLWSSPVEAGLFTGDLGIPSNYETGQVISSSRKIGVTASDVWAFYSERLTNGGWKSSSNAPAADDDYFSAEFVKGNRYVTVKWYSTINSDGTGQASTYGARIELWYK